MIDNSVLNKLKGVNKNSVDAYVRARIDELHRSLETASGEEVTKMQGQIQELRTLIHNIDVAKQF